MKIHIEFCIKWNYGPEFDRVSKEIKRILPDAIIKGNSVSPRSGAFEISLNKNLIYSYFTQRYESNNFNTTSNKELFWKKEKDGVWRILYEDT